MSKDTTGVSHLSKAEQDKILWGCDRMTEVLECYSYEECAYMLAICSAALVEASLALTGDVAQ